LSRREVLGIAAGVGAGLVVAAGTQAGVAQAQMGGVSGDVARPSASLTLAGAHMALMAAVAKAQEIGVPMTIVVVDEGGHMKAAARMDGNAAGSIEVVERKAHTSATFRAATHVLGQRAESGTQARFVSFANLPNIWMGGGGVPMMREGQMIGAIGAGGGTPEQDIVVAEAGAAAVA
jgi:uncharacterized protein GlcG (DUF336 family)